VLLSLPLLLARLTALVCRNALAEMSQDLPVCSSRGDRPAAVTGLWPLLTAFNHSCAANAVAVLVGGVPTAVEQQQQQQQKLLATQQQQTAAVKAAQLRKAAANGRTGPTNRWAKPQGSFGAKTSASSASPSSSSSSSSNAPLTVPGSGLMAVSSQPGEGPYVLVRAVSDMSPGDEVTLDYLSPGVEGSLVTPERRQAALLQRWGFRCR
jgi:hypothetical protein